MHVARLPESLACWASVPPRRWALTSLSLVYDGNARPTSIILKNEGLDTAYMLRFDLSVCSAAPVLLHAYGFYVPEQTTTDTY